MLTNRVISAIALTQVACIVIGFFTIRFYTLALTSDDPDVLDTVHFSWSAVFLRSYGWIFIAIPALWLPYAIASRRTEQGWLSSQVAIIVGGGLAVTLALWFIFTAFNTNFGFS